MRRMKVKIFDAATKRGSFVSRIDRAALDQLQAQIDQWLKDNPGIKVIHIKQSSAGGSWGPIQLFMSVWYESAP
jgi:hypothetical protein